MTKREKCSGCGRYLNQNNVCTYCEKALDEIDHEQEESAIQTAEAQGHL